MAPPKKNQKMSLGDFLGDQSLGSWADEMEDMPVGSGPSAGYGGGERRAFSSAGTFGREPGGFDRYPREQLPLPTKPPYTAHLGNLSFDATEGDVQDFFAGCEVSSVRIVEDKLERKPKGFGYVEFRSLDGLKRALDLSGTQFQGRNIRISVADPPKDRPEARELNDWTRKGPLPDLPNQGGRRVSDRGGYRNWEGASDAGSDAGGRSRRPFNEGDGKVRDFGNWERKGPLSPVPAPSGDMRTTGRIRSNDGPRQDRRNSPSWGQGRGEGGSQDGSRPPRREFQERPHVERQPTAAELDNQWRSKMRPDEPAKSPLPSPMTSTPSSPAPAHAVPTIRPKLNLAKRTVSEAQPMERSTSSDSKASPFGAARPIDTAAREREIEEKRHQQLKEKKEREEKAREEKKAREAKEAAAKPEKAVAASEDGGKSTSSKDAKENGSGDAPVTKNYEILQRISTEDGGDGDADENPEGDANGTIVDDKAIKPQETVRDPAKEEQGSWRRKSSTPATTAENLEGDGWSTVPQKKGKNNRRGGHQGAQHAIAS